MPFFGVVATVIVARPKFVTEAEIKAAIYFTANGDDLRVIYNIPGEAAEIQVPAPTVGQVIVRALRNLQRDRG